MIKPQLQTKVVLKALTLLLTYTSNAFFAAVGNVAKICKQLYASRSQSYTSPFKKAVM
jgi:hypothetical protein